MITPNIMALGSTLAAPQGNVNCIPDVVETQNGSHQYGFQRLQKEGRREERMTIIWRTKPSQAPLNSVERLLTYTNARSKK
jgi:hypothetical protein